MFNGHKLELNELRLLCFRSKKFFLSLLLLFWPVWTFIFVFFNCLYLFLTVFYNSALINNSNDFITWSANVDLHPNWLEEYLGHFLKWHCKQKKMSSTNEDNEDLEKSDMKSESSKLFHSDFGSTWPFKTRRRSSNDSRLMLLGGK